MIDELLPEPVVAVEAYGEEADRAPLYPEEEAVVAQAVAGRRREFAAVRSCARRAMAKLGVPPQLILPGEQGAPRWPESLIGSMTHCDGYRAAALVRAADLVALGIDVEPHAPLPDEILPLVSLPAERERLVELAARQPSVHWDRLLFSAKESVFKAWFPMTGKWLEFEGADIEVDARSGVERHGDFRATLRVPGPFVRGRRVRHFEGRWTVRHDLIATAVIVPH